MIKPTVGRVVWFYDGSMNQLQPMAAMVVFVHSDRMVNLVVFNQNGVAHGETSITLVQPEDADKPAGSYCAWMPYQKGQAAKTEALETAAAARDAGKASY